MYKHFGDCQCHTYSQILPPPLPPPTPVDNLDGQKHIIIKGFDKILLILITHYIKIITTKSITKIKLHEIKTNIYISLLCYAYPLVLIATISLFPARDTEK